MVQRYRCLRCAKSFSESQPLDGLRIEIKQAAQVVSLLAEGVGIRAAARLTGLNQQTVLHVLRAAGEHCARLMESKVCNLKVEQVQADEVWGYVFAKQQNSPLSDRTRGDQYVYLAVDRHSKLIICSHVGKRDIQTSRSFLEILKRRTSGRFQLSTDGFVGYIGYNGAVNQTFGDSIDYGSETKYYGKEQDGPRRYSPVKVLAVSKMTHLGQPKLDMINTSFAERTNLSARLFNRRLTRLTLGFSKTLENLLHSVDLMVAHFNFCRVHSAIDKTPAMAQGLTDHKWSTDELLSATI